MKHLCISLFCFFLGLGALWAQPSSDASFELNLSYDTIGIEESLTLRYVLHNTQAIGQFEPPSFTNGQLVAGPMISQSMSSINGHVTRSCTYTYVIRPENLGLLFLPATTIETEAGWLEIAEQTVVVVEEVPYRPQTNPDPMARRSPFDHPFFRQQGMQPLQDMERMEQFFNQPFDLNAPFDLELELPVEPAKPVPKRKKERKTYRI